MAFGWDERDAEVSVTRVAGSARVTPFLHERRDEPDHVPEWLLAQGGRRIADRFEVLDVLGHGGMGGVVRVRDTRPPADRAPGGRFRTANDEYALKLLGGGDGSRTSGHERSSPTWRFVREYRMGLRKLSRSGRAVRSYDYGIDDDGTSAFFTSDLVPGGSLPRFSEPQPVAMVAALALELLTVLDELHEQEVVHRDLKGANILCDRPWSQVQQELGSLAEGSRDGDPGEARARFPKLVLADFGISRHGSLRDDTPLGNVVGTLAYLPPESMQIGNLDARADLYAAGVILYQAATGQHPLRAANTDAQRMLAGQPFKLRQVRDLVPAFPAALDQAITGLLEPDPQRRTRTAAIAHDAFAAWWTSGPQPLTLAAQPSLRGKPYLGTPRFVGREHELATARGFLDETLGFTPPVEPSPQVGAVSDRVAREQLPTSVLVLRGEAGVGKSRLLGQIHRHAHDRADAPLIVVGQCVQGGGGAYHSLQTILDALERASDAAPALEPASDELLAVERVPGAEDPEYVLLRREARGAAEVHVQAELRRQLFLQRASAHLLRVARWRPVLVIQEDSQWADESSLALLEHMLLSLALARGRGHPARAAFVFTQRPAAPDNAVARFDKVIAAQAEHERPPTRIELGGMAPEQVVELVASLLGCEPGPGLAAFTEALFGGQDVRPLWVEHTLRAYLAAGHLTQGTNQPRPGGTMRWTGVWCLDPEVARAAPRPSSLHEAIGKNAQQLSAGTANVLKYAAAAGRQFSLDLVARAAGEDAIAALDYLDEAAAAGFVADVEQLDASQAASRTRGRELSFCHDRYREAVYDALAEDERRACHRALASAVAALRGDSPEVAEQLARHHAAAANYPAAFASALRAAEHAAEMGAYDRATDLYAAAIDYAARAGSPVPAPVRDGHARVAVYSGRFDDAARELEALAEAPGLSAPARWDASLRLAELRYRKQQYHSAIEPLERVLRDMGERVPRGRLARNLIAAPHIARIVARGLLPGAIRMTPARDPALAEVRSRAWYLLAESYTFVDAKDVLFAGAVNGGQCVSLGLHGFSAVVFAGMAYLFGAQGLGVVSRRYEAAARQLVEGDEIRIGAPDVSARATVHMLLIGARQFRGELAPQHWDSLHGAVAQAFDAVQVSGDPQRFWLVLAFVANLNWHRGHFETYVECVRWTVRLARERRLDALEYLQTNYADARTGEIQGDFVAAERAWVRFCSRSREVGDEYDQRVGEAHRVWTHALRSDPGRGEGIDALVAQAFATIERCLEKRFLYFEGPIVPRALGAVLLMEPGAPSARIARLVRACRSMCMNNAVPRALYVAVGAALDARRGATGRARRRFEEATELGIAAGMIDGVLDVYRLAARVLPEGSRERAVYERLEHMLAERIAAAPGMSTRQLTEGECAAPVIVPRASELEARQLAGR